MAETFIGTAFTGATETATEIVIPKNSLIDTSLPAVNRFVPAASNTLESIIAAQSQKYALVFTEAAYDEPLRNLQVIKSDTTVNAGIAETVFTYTFKRELTADDLANIDLKPSAI